MAGRRGIKPAVLLCLLALCLLIVSDCQGKRVKRGRKKAHKGPKRRRSAPLAREDLTLPITACREGWTGPLCEKGVGEHAHILAAALQEMIPEKKMWYGPKGELVHTADLAPVASVTVEEFKKRLDLQSGIKPFHLKGALAEWPAMQKWSGQFFANKFPNIVTDYYFEGKQSTTHQGRLVPMEVAFQDFQNARHEGRSPYLLWYVKLADWRKFESDTQPMYKWLLNTEYTLEECLGYDGLASLYDFSFWRMILMGQNNTMFNLHYDSVQSATWQAQIKGRKMWNICPPSQTPFMYRETAKHLGGQSNMNTFYPDYTKYPLFKRAKCYTITAEAGDILYYPPNWWHQTLNLGHESIALTSRVIHPGNYHSVIDDLRKECNKPPRKVPEGWQAPPTLSKHVCASLDKCDAALGQDVGKMLEIE